MLDLKIPDLTFPMVKYGRNEIPWDLSRFLYKGGASAISKQVTCLIEAGELGPPIVERVELVVRLHAKITGDLVAGGAKQTALNRYKRFKSFFVWAEDAGHPLSLDSIETTYRGYIDHLRYRVRLKSISERAAYNQAINLSIVLDDVLERSRPLITTTPLRMQRRSIRALSVAADKQNLQDTFAFGHFLLDIIDATSLKAIWGPLPLTIKLRSGTVLEEWSHLRDPKTVVSLQAGYKNTSTTKKVKVLRADWEADCSLRTRSSLVNLRIMAEMLLFIGQTGMNLSQAHQLKICQFRYKSTIDGYEVRDYKHRRKGEILFEIFANYRAVFEQYLAWRDEVLGNQSTDLLFPFITMGRLVETPPDFSHFKKRCKVAGISFISPQKLRNTRVNWLLRRSRDPNQTAEQAQHTPRTLLDIYERPSLQVAMAEIIQFWRELDPSLRNTAQPCPAPGVCNGQPESKPNLPPDTPKPDCIHPSGCLFCSHHRDIDTEDYVWSVASMRHFKTIVLSGFRPVVKSKSDPARPVELAIEVLTAKLKWYRESNADRSAWVEEALARIDEGEFHPHWRYLIESAEGA